MNKPWLLILIFIGIFATGAVSGGFVAVRYTRAVVRQKVAEQFGMQQLKQFGDQLGLTREQRDRIRPILLKAGDQLRDLRNDIASVNEQMDDDLRKELNDAQRVKFDELREQIRNDQKERQRRMQRWLKEQKNFPPAPVEGAPKS